MDLVTVLPRSDDTAGELIVADTSVVRMAEAFGDSFATELFIDEIGLAADPDLGRSDLLRSRPISIDLDVLNAAGSDPGARFDITPFPDMSFQLIVTQAINRGGSNGTIFGKIAGAGLARFRLVRMGDCMMLRVDDFAANKHLEIRRLEDGSGYAKRSAFAPA